MIRRTALAATVLLTLSACRPTSYNSSADTTLPASTSSTLPTGALHDLLPRMQREVDGLSALVVTGKGDRESATRIEQYWAAIQPEVAKSWPDLVEDFDFAVRLCRSAADRRRPANADRAAKNLDALAVAILG